MHVCNGWDGNRRSIWEKRVMCFPERPIWWVENFIMLLQNHWSDSFGEDAEGSRRLSERLLGKVFMDVMI